MVCNGITMIKNTQEVQKNAFSLDKTGRSVQKAFFLTSCVFWVFLSERWPSTLFQILRVCCFVCNNDVNFTAVMTNFICIMYIKSL